MAKFLAITIISGIVLAELYVAFGRSFSLDPVVAAWLVNFSAFMILGNPLIRGAQSPSMTASTSSRKHYIPAIVVVAGSLLLGIISSRSGRNENYGDWDITYLLLTVVAVPVVEELLFRKRLANWFTGHLSPNWAIYANALFFSWMHSQPTLNGLMAGSFNLPLGPFLLGLICAQIYRLSNQIGPAIAFHIACNSTVVIFSRLDARWLEWLQFLYIGQK